MADAFDPSRCGGSPPSDPQTFDFVNDCEVPYAPPPIPDANLDLPLVPPNGGNGGSSTPPGPPVQGSGPPTTPPPTGSGPGTWYIDNSTGNVYTWTGTTWNITTTQLVQTGTGPKLTCLINVCQDPDTKALTQFMFESWRLPSGSQLVSRFCETPDNICCPETVCSDTVTLPNGCVLPKCLCSQFTWDNGWFCTCRLTYDGGDSYSWSGTITVCGHEIPVNFRYKGGGAPGNCVDYAFTFDGTVYAFNEECNCDLELFKISTITYTGCGAETITASVEITGDSGGGCTDQVCDGHSSGGGGGPGGGSSPGAIVDCCVQLGTSGSFVAPRNGAVTFFFNDDLHSDNVGTYSLTFGGTPYTVASDDTGTAGPTLVAGTTYTFTASGLVEWNGSGGPRCR